MPRCPNCGKKTLKTEDWVCQWCGYPLLSKTYKKINKTYKQLQAERGYHLNSTKREPKYQTGSEPEIEARPEVEAEVKRLEPSSPQPKIRLKNGLILLNLVDVVLVLVIIFLPSNVLRIILVIPFLLFFPGHTLLVAIFPRKEEIGGIERVVLSFGLSVVVVSLIGLILNYAPWGIKMEPLLYSTVSFILLASIIAWLRQRGLIENERFGITLSLSFLGWGKCIKDRMLTIILALAILGALGTLVYIMATPKQGETFTEFYILGQQGKSADYPDKLKVGDDGRVIVGIINHERIEVSYSIGVVVGSDTTAVVGPLVLVNEQNWEGEVGFVAKVPGEDQKVEFVLYKDGKVEPYKELHLWLDVTE